MFLRAAILAAIPAASPIATQGDITRTAAIASRSADKHLPATNTLSHSFTTRERYGIVYIRSSFAATYFIFFFIAFQ